ncbi:peptidyl-prolyl cis-trans isomerase [Sulfitobacter sp. LCG007]
MAKRKSFSSTLVWILMAMLILGLGGFGMTNLGGQIRTIGTVGDKSLSITTYGRMLQQEMRAFEQQTGQPLTWQRAQELGIDQAVLQRFVQMRALDNETDRMGLSVGDEVLRERIMEIPGFQGVDGTFDRDAYKMTLDRSNMSEATFEAQLREDVARSLLQGAVSSGIEMPSTYADTLVTYIAESRSFTWSQLGGADLSEPLPEPDEAALRAFYDANIDAYSLPETKRITYDMLLPDDLLGAIDVSDEDLRAEYDRREAEFNQPERRLVERLAYLDDAAADAAAQALAAGSSFEDLVNERGLALADVDLGDVGETDLGEAGPEVFAAEVGSVVGPLPSTLGPALFRVNAVLPAQVTSFEDARGTLQENLARERARRQIEAVAQQYEDMLAGGATLEELAEETDMTLGQLDWTPESADGIAAYESFRTAAQALSEDDFPSIMQLDDGGIFAMRLNGVLPPRPAPYEDVAEAVRAGWEAQEIGARLLAQAETLAATLREGGDFAAAGLDAVREQGLTRQATVPGTPPGFVEAAFAMEPGEIRVLPGEASATIIRLDSIDGPQQGPDAEALRAQLQQQVDQSLAQNLFTLYVSQVTTQARAQIDDSAVQAVHANFR